MHSRPIHLSWISLPIRGVTRPHYLYRPCLRILELPLLDVNDGAITTNPVRNICSEKINATVRLVENTALPQQHGDAERTALWVIEAEERSFSS